MGGSILVVGFLINAIFSVFSRLAGRLARIRRSRSRFSVRIVLLYTTNYPLGLANAIDSFAEC